MTAGLTGEIILVYLIGLCPALALSRNFDAAIGLGAVTVIMAPPAALVGYWIAQTESHVIVVLPLLLTSIFVTTLCSAKLIERFLRKLHGLLNPYVPLMVVNCTLLGIVLISANAADDAVGATLHALSLACGYALVLAVFSQLRERLHGSDVPTPFRDTPVALITLGLIALGLFGFTGMRTL
jgi:Na+-translocating ferredoxin:NAD+ oxidoreductase subunit A